MEIRAKDIARDLVRAIREKHRHPATEMDLRFWQFMGGLISAEKDGVMADDYRHWQKHDLFDSFEGYIGQAAAQVPVGDEKTRRAWVKEMIAAYKDEKKLGSDPAGIGSGVAGCERPDPQSAPNLLELLKRMPQGLDKDAAAGIEAIYQFEVSGDENFTAHVVVSGQTAEFREGPAENPTVVIKTPADVWLSISRGELDGQSAFMAGKYTTEGDLGILMKLGQLFAA